MSASHVKSPFGPLPESFHHNIPHGREQEQAEISPLQGAQEVSPWSGAIGYFRSKRAVVTKILLVHQLLEVLRGSQADRQHLV